jgi:hypothetical protein
VLISYSDAEMKAKYITGEKIRIEYRKAAKRRGTYKSLVSSNEVRSERRLSCDLRHHRSDAVSLSRHLSYYIT